MKIKLTPEKIAANRANAQKSTGPKTPFGRAHSKMNALKNSLLLRDTTVQGMYIKENDRELAALRRDLYQDLQPVGRLEEVLVDLIVTTLWRSHRVLKAETGEIALSVDNGVWQRRPERNNEDVILDEDPEKALSQSGFGNYIMRKQLRDIREYVENHGELTDAALQEVCVHGKPYSVTYFLYDVRNTFLLSNPAGLDTEDFRARQKEHILAAIDLKMVNLESYMIEWAEHEEKQQKAHQAAAVLPPPDVLDKIIDYDAKLKRQLYRALNQLERLQRMRRGELIPPPLAMDIEERSL
jgi:hypothetical protein